ncbi:MAG: alpha/beta fold hydrolase [Bauldia sp.]
MKAGDIHFNVVVEGPPGAPWVVLSNSLATNLSLWESLAAALRGRYRVFRYDQRGHGLSTASPPPYSLPLLVEDVVHLMDQAGIERANFVGISMGGATGWGLAHHHHERLISLTVCDSALAASSAAEWEKRLAIVRSEGLGALVEPTLARWFTSQSIAQETDAVRQVRKMIRTTSQEGFIGCVMALQTYSYSEGVEALRLPVLLVAGSQDGLRPKTMAEDARRIIGARLAVIPNAGHLSNIENPAEFNRVVGSFLDAQQL